MKPQLALFIPAATAATITPPYRNQTTCDEGLLREATNRYIAAQSTGQPEWLSTLLAANATLIENNAAIPLAESTVLHQPLSLAHARSTHDTTACATFSELVALAPGYQIGTQLRVASTRARGRSPRSTAS